MYWNAVQAAGKSLHLLPFVDGGFFRGIFSLAGLFTMWWWPAMPGVVFCSATALVLLFVAMDTHDGMDRP